MERFVIGESVNELVICDLLEIEDVFSKLQPL